MLGHGFGCATARPSSALRAPFSTTRRAFFTAFSSCLLNSLERDAVKRSPSISGQGGPLCAVLCAADYRGPVTLHQVRCVVVHRFVGASGDQNRAAFHGLKEFFSLLLNPSVDIRFVMERRADPG